MGPADWRLCDDSGVPGSGHSALVQEEATGSQNISCHSRSTCPGIPQHGVTL